MKVTFRRSGGFVPMPVGCVIDTESCSEADAKQLQELVTASDVMHSESASVPGARDVRYYMLQIENGDATKSLKFDELSVPPKVKPLVQFLQERSTSLLPEN